MRTRAWLVPSVLLVAACQAGSVIIADDGGSGFTTPVTTDDTKPFTTTTTQAEGLSKFDGRLHDQLGSVAYATWEQDGTATSWVEYSFDEGEWLSSPQIERSTGAQEQILLGIPYGMEVTWRVVAEFAGGTQTSIDRVFETAPVPGTLPMPEVLVNDTALQDPSTPYLLTSLNRVGADFGGRWWAVIYDRQGRPVWGLETPQGRIAMHTQLSYDGRTLLIDNNSFWGTWDGGTNSTVLRMHIDGNVVHTYDTPGLHHPFTDMPDGSIAFGSAGFFYSDETLEIVREDGEIDVLWACDDWLDSIAEPSYCGSNTLRYDLASNTFLFSFYSVDSVVEIDASTGESLRSFGHVNGSYSFDPPSSAFWWQHGAYYLESGNLLLSTKDEQGGNETLVREFELDPSTNTLVQVWSFGTDEGLYGPEMGEATRMANGNTQHNYGTLPRLREVTTDGLVVWDMAWGSGHDIGRSTPVEDLWALMP